MQFSRRDVLLSAAALAVVPKSGWSNGALTLDARPGQQQIAPDSYGKTRIWGYDGGTPGPEIRVAQGTRIRRDLLNSLEQPTATHWHGIRIDNAMDGVPGLTQDAVMPGERFTYDFEVRDAGTYWYHAHNRSMEQVARGLYGPLIVEESTPPDVDREYILMLDDWRLDPETVQITDDFDNGHDMSHAGRIGNLMTVNGRFDPAFEVGAGERLRLRLVNAANSRVFRLGLDGLEGWIVALDGMPLETPLEIGEQLALAPAQRADLIVDVQDTGDAPASLISVERNGRFGLCRFERAAETRPVRSDQPAPLPPNPLPEIRDVAAAPLHRMTLQGGAMRWLENAYIGDTLLSGRELAELGRFWALNGRAERPSDPFADLNKGSLHRIAFVNETAFPHAMHLHGHHFRLIGEDGTLGPWRDTVLVERGETRQIALVADNPGDWLLHCHMLGHAAAGMMSWFRVT